jgi:homoaconitase/3-isopropylmalate dehydratase large subunit
MAMNVTQKLIATHLVAGEMTPGKEIGLKVDQTLTQDATGTLVMLELEAMGLDRPDSARRRLNTRRSRTLARSELRIDRRGRPPNGTDRR